MSCDRVVALEVSGVSVVVGDCSVETDDETVWLLWSTDSSVVDGFSSTGACGSSVE